jgi:hypothetical protein
LNTIEQRQQHERIQRDQKILELEKAPRARYGPTL